MVMSNLTNILEKTIKIKIDKESQLLLNTDEY